MNQAPSPSSGLSELAKRRMVVRDARPLFLSEWERTVFIHYRIDPHHLQPLVPFPLDLHDGQAYVSLVAFTMRRLRPARWPRLARWLTAPIADHRFLNVRTYVRHHGETGIYFLAEWLPNRVSVALGPRTFGLPYRHGRLEYHHDHEHGVLRGIVAAVSTAGRLSYEARVDPTVSFYAAPADSLDEFLVERYTAFTMRGRTPMLFRIWHEPWPLAPIHARVRDATLLSSTGRWFEYATPLGAHYSPGVTPIWIGRPRRAGPREANAPCVAPSPARFVDHPSSPSSIGGNDPCTTFPSI